MKKFTILTIILVSTLVFLNSRNNNLLTNIPDSGGPEEITHPLMVSEMRRQTYQGSEITILEDLPSGSNYSRHIASYVSEGLKINALLSIPNADPPEGGFPTIIFNHGWIQPDLYKTTERYVDYFDAFARAGYVVIKPDYRGHAESEGESQSAYISPAYTTDVLNAVASIKKFENINPEKIGMWGHSMGGAITLRSMVVTNDIKAGVIWAGVVASHQDLLLNWQSSRGEDHKKRIQRQITPDLQGLLNEISPINYTKDLSGPLQIHHGTADQSVPWEFSQTLDEVLTQNNIDHEYYLYQGADHNLSGSAFGPAITRSVNFFDKHLK